MKDGAERIVKRVLDDAQAEADKIAKEAEDKALQIVAEAEQKASRKTEQMLDQASKGAEEHEKRIISAFQLEARKEVLAAKKKLIDQSFSEALNRLLSMDEGSYLKVIRQMLLDMVEDGIEKIACSADDLKKIPDSFWKDINQVLESKGKVGKLSLSDEPAAIKGGFILLSDDIEINGSFEALLDQHREELEPEIAKVLFKQ